MNTRVQIQPQRLSAPTFSPVPTGVLQRACACGNHTMGGGECNECSKKKRLGLQTKLQVNEPGDVYEQEADRIAEQVLAAPAHHAVSGAPPHIQRFSGQLNGQLDAAPASVDQALASPGRPLEPALRQDMEQRFGHDFSRVRVHSGAAAEQSAQDVNAHAYTVGYNIVFGAGRFTPGTDQGRRLLAHELTHAVQQSGADRLRAGQSNKKCSLSLSADYSIARKPRTGATDAPPSAVKTMARDEARAVLTAYIEKGGIDDTFAAMNAIEETLDTPSTSENWRMRVRLLTAAFSLLDAEGAASVLKALTTPGTKQEHLHKRFLRLDSDFRRPLLEILRERAAAKPVPEAEQADKPSQGVSLKSKATWVELHEGVFAYVPDPGMTLNNVAAYVSGNPEVPDALADLNGFSRTTPIPQGQSIIIPIEFIDRAKALEEMSDPVRSRIVSMQVAEAQNAAYRRFIQVKSGHPLGPGAVGLIPLTMVAIRQIVTALKHLIEKAEYAIAFVAGVVHGFLKSIWDAVAGIAKLLYDILTSVLSGLISDVEKLVSSISKLSWDKIKDAVGEWAAEWAEKLHSNSPWIAGHAHGYLTGYIMAEAAMLLLSGGTVAELKGAIWSSKLGELVKASRAFRTLESSIAKIAEVSRAAGGKVAEGIEVLRQSRLAKVVKVVEVTGAAALWTAGKVMKLLKLPGYLAQYVVEKLVTHAKQLGPFFERIGELTEAAQRWLFGCHSPCEWEADAVEKTMTELTNTQIEEIAVATAAKGGGRRRYVTISPPSQPKTTVSAPPSPATKPPTPVQLPKGTYPEGHSGTTKKTPTRVKPDPTTARPTGPPSTEDADILSQRGQRKQVSAYPSAHKHHVFPQELEAWFNERFKGSEDIHEYTVFLSEGEHQAIHLSGKGGIVKGVKEPNLLSWNEEWKNFKRDHQFASPQEIFEEAGRLMDKYKISAAEITSYRQRK